VRLFHTENIFAAADIKKIGPFFWFDLFCLNVLCSSEMYQDPFYENKPRKESWKAIWRFYTVSVLGELLGML